MKNSYDDIFKYIKENDICSFGISVEILKNKDLNNPNTLIELQEIETRYEDSPNKYSEEIMTYLRQRRGLEKYDTSEDREINKMGKSEVFNDVVSWNNLSGGWDRIIKKWVKEIYGIDLDKLEE